MDTVMSPRASSVSCSLALCPKKALLLFSSPATQLLGPRSNTGRLWVQELAGVCFASYTTRYCPESPAKGVILGLVGLVASSRNTCVCWRHRHDSTPLRAGGDLWRMRFTPSPLTRRYKLTNTAKHT